MWFYNYRYCVITLQEAHRALRRSHDYTCNVIATKLTPLSTPPGGQGVLSPNLLYQQRVIQILFDLHTEHNSDKACYENGKYPIGFIWT